MVILTKPIVICTFVTKCHKWLHLEASPLTHLCTRRYICLLPIFIQILNVFDLHSQKFVGDYLANTAVANKYDVAHGLSIGIFTFDRNIF